MFKNSIQLMVVSEETYCIWVKMIWKVLYTRDLTKHY